MPAERKTNHPVWIFLLAAVTSGILSVILDLVTAAFQKPLTVPVFFAVFICLTAGLFFAFQASNKVRIILPSISCAVVIMGLALVLIWYSFSRNAVYETTDNGKSQFFAGKTVMVLCPHQDDDLNILGGVLEEFQSYGSNVIVVFSTNGDFIDTATGLERLQEALNVADFYNLDESNVIFLGYGDGYLDDYPNIYNSGNEVVVSHAWNSRTYGLDFHDAYDSEADYTGNNYREDLYHVITDYMPDMIFTCDYDDHTDHRALSLAADEVIGEILKDYDSYEPLVFKTLAYSLAYYDTEDFYSSINIKSTVNPYETETMKERPDYLWADRVRIPVSASSLSRSLFSDSLYQALKLYATQGAGNRGVSIVNGDRVYWQRDTSSVLYDADITVSSGDGYMLNNFMIIDSNDLADTDRLPYDSAWVPADDLKEADVSLGSETLIDRICLYDNPDPDSNVLNAEIVLDDGTVYETGPLNVNGTATEIMIGRKVSSFSVRLLETEGPSAGLAEIEAFTGKSATDGPSFIKLQNEDGDFVYDYFIDDSGEETFSLYTYGNDVKLEECGITCSNESCSAYVTENGFLTVVCPAGETTCVTVTDPSGTMADTVKFSHAPALTVFGQKLESRVFPLLDGLRSAVIYSLLRNIYYSL